MRFLIFFLNKCRTSSGSAEQNLKQEFGKIIVRYMQIKLQFEQQNESAASKKKTDQTLVK